MSGKLSKLFYDLSNPTAFSSHVPLSKFAPIKTVDNFLNNQSTWTRYKAVRHTFPRRRTTGEGIFSHLQVDLCDVSGIAKHNAGNNFILTGVCSYSRMVVAEPVHRKTGVLVAEAFETIFKRLGLTPSFVISDAGLEFRNSDVKDLFDRYHIQHIVTKSLLKASMVERFNRTLKTRLYKYFHHSDTKRWVDILQKLVVAINNSHNRGIGTCPQKIFDGKAKPRLTSRGKSVKQVARYRIGDEVRLSKARQNFQKGYESGWTEKKYLVSEIVKPRFSDEPFAYRVVDSNTGTFVPGILYEQELVYFVE